MEGVLSKGMATPSEHLQTWKLKLNTKKAMMAVFHLNNKEAKRELKLNRNNGPLSFCYEPTYLYLSTSEKRWTGRSRIADTSSHFAKCLHHAALFRRLAGLGAGATTLRRATLALVHSTAEYCTPVWCRNAHTCLPPINDTLRIAAGGLRPGL